jgi:hypothetical protein
VRIQFSRDLDPATFKGRIHVAYTEAPPAGRTETPSPSLDFAVQYAAFNRVIELKFTKPLQQFRTVKVELLPGILGTDQQPVKPWTLLFSLGGN